MLLHSHIHKAILTCNILTSSMLTKSMLAPYIRQTAFIRSWFLFYAYICATHAVVLHANFFSFSFIFCYTQSLVCESKIKRLVRQHVLYVCRHQKNWMKILTTAVWQMCDENYSVMQLYWYGPMCLCWFSYFSRFIHTFCMWIGSWDKNQMENDLYFLQRTTMSN